MHFGNILESNLGDLLSDKFGDSKKVIITDENVFELWGSWLLTNFEALAQADVIVLPAGEENKTLEECAQVWGALTDYEIGRKDLIINFGGGVITDMGGFVAATFKRGMDFINIPTTLLSQVDASIGGKTGIDFGSFKNQIGVFADPRAVYIDDQFLSTLAENEKISGYAEMLKHGLISDRNLWDTFKTLDPTSEDLLSSIMSAVEVKKGIVELDFEEGGERKKLNLGHTIGHALESNFLENGNHQPHGFCVAWGIVAEAKISVEMGMLSSADFDEIKSVVGSKFPKLNISLNEKEKLVKLMSNDKKNSGNSINFSLLSEIGECRIDQFPDQELIEKGLDTILYS